VKQKQSIKGTMSGSRMTEELEARRIDALRVIGTCQIRCRARLWPCIADRCMYIAECGIGDGEIALCKTRPEPCAHAAASANFSQSRIRVRGATRQRFAVYGNYTARITASRYHSGADNCTSGKTPRHGAANAIIFGTGSRFLDVAIKPTDGSLINMDKLEARRARCIYAVTNWLVKRCGGVTLPLCVCVCKSRCVVRALERPHVPVFCDIIVWRVS